VKNYAVEIRRWKVDDEGWRVSPSGLHVKIGKNVIIHPDAKIGNFTTLGEGSSMGKGASMGNRSSMGNGASMGYGASMGNGASMGEGASMIPGVSIPSGKIEVVKYTIQMQGPNYPAILLPGNLLKIGCQMHPLDEWDRIKDMLYDKHSIRAEDRVQYDKIIKAMRVFASGARHRRRNALRSANNRR
jgi:NDP-sugar pyrophosphorylase family protein